MNGARTYHSRLVMLFVLLACGFALAQSQSVRLPSGTQIIVIVPMDVQVTSGTGGDTIIVTGIHALPRYAAGALALRRVQAEVTTHQRGATQ